MPPPRPSLVDAELPIATLAIENLLNSIGKLVVVLSNLWGRPQKLLPYPGKLPTQAARVPQFSVRTQIKWCSYRACLHVENLHGHSKRRLPHRFDSTVGCHIRLTKPTDTLTFPGTLSEGPAFVGRIARRLIGAMVAVQLSWNLFHPRELRDGVPNRSSGAGGFAAMPRPRQMPS